MICVPVFESTAAAAVKAMVRAARQADIIELRLDALDDLDEAGEAASLRNMDMFISEAVNVYIAELPKGYDPDNYIRKFGTDDFIKLTKSSKNLFDYKLNKLSARFDIRTANGKASIAGEMLPTIARVNNAVLKSALVKKLAEKLSVDEDSIRQELKKVKPDRFDNGNRRYRHAP